jgi:hypothetical protein
MIEQIITQSCICSKSTAESPLKVVTDYVTRRSIRDLAEREADII